MSFNTDDPKYTDYVLDEVTEEQRAAIEREMHDSPEVRKLVDDLRSFAKELEDALSKEPSPELGAERRRMIFDSFQRHRQPGRKPFVRGLFALVAAAAALLLVSAWLCLPAGSPGPDHVAMMDNVGSPRLPACPPPPPGASPGHQSQPAAQQPAPLALEKRFILETEAESNILQADTPGEAGELPTSPDRLSEHLVESVDKYSQRGRMTAQNIYSRRPIRTGPAPVVDSVRGSDRELSAISGAARGWQSDETPAARALPTSTVKRSPTAMRLPRSLPELASQPFLSPSLDDFPELRDNEFLRVEDHPLSTFSIDVDSASYSVVRRFLQQGRMPPRDAVRVEELINYFPYDLAPPEGSIPFAAHLDMTAAPWNPENRLVRIALKGRTVANEVRPPLNLVFLIDVSGSMRPPSRLPLVIRSMRALTKQLDARDHVAIVVYAGASGLVLPPTRGDNTELILGALDRLRAGGGTAGGAGIQLAYEVAQEHFDPEAVNRVILCTDGDFNVGITQRGDLERLIEEKAKTGVFLTVLGFGIGNFKDSTLELLSNKGNGNYAYIDDFGEARKVLVDQMLGTLVTIAKDVKIQIEFNPAHVAGYRLIGYENRLLRSEDFNNDRVDAGDIGAGHTVTAFYELIPVGHPVTSAPAVDPLKYQAPKSEPAAAHGAELLTVKVRYKEPEGGVSSRLEFPLDADAVKPLDETSHDFRFAAAVAAFGQLLRNNEYLRAFTYDDVLGLAAPAVGDDPQGYRDEFLRLVLKATEVAKKRVLALSKDWSNLHEVFVATRKALTANAISESDLIGKESGRAFRDVTSNEGIIIGFKLTTMKFGYSWSHTAIGSIQPLYLTSSGPVQGQVHGSRGHWSDKGGTILARDGYAVGGLQVVATSRIRGLRVIFMRIQGDSLDVNDAYLSDWCGDSRDDSAPMAGGDGKLVVGLIGEWKTELRKIGLIQLRQGSVQPVWSQSSFDSLKRNDHSEDRKESQRDDTKRAVHGPNEPGQSLSDFEKLKRDNPELFPEQ